MPPRPAPSPWCCSPRAARPASPIEQMPGWALLGAIVETVPATFFELTGPDKTALAARADFGGFIDGLMAK